MSSAMQRDPLPDPPPPDRGPRRRAWAVVLGILALGALPPAAYWFGAGDVPAVTVPEARAELARPGGSAVLVDVRSPDIPAADRPAGAVAWPLEAIEAAASRAEIPEPLRGKRFLALCDAGYSSARAVRRLRALGCDAVNVEGGMMAWRGVAEGGAAAPGPCPVGVAYYESPPFEQGLAIASGFVVKPVYMLLALALIAALWRRREPDLAALRRGLIAFDLGELFCFLNYALTDDASRLMEYLHSYGMALALGFGAYAAFLALDRRVVGFSAAEARCALLGLCRPCAKNAEAPCGLRRLFLWLIPLAGLLALMPLTAPLRPVAYATRIAGTPYLYAHPLPYQVYEIRVCPALAAVLMAAAWLVLRFKRREAVAWAQIVFSAGLGFMAFGLLRLALLAFYRDRLVWFTWWEEATELVGVLGACAVLWIFRKGIFAAPVPPTTTE
jgi:rhodanese-related sulfurtransferase